MKFRIISTLAALFMLGGASGYLAGKPASLPAPNAPTQTALPRSPRLDQIFTHWRNHLNLTPDQIDAMQPVLAASDEKMRVIQAETAEKIRALLRENARELRSRLTPEQAAEFDRLTQQMIFKQSSR